MFSPAVLPLGRLPLLSVTWEVHHRSIPSSVPLHIAGESGLERKLLIFASALKGGLPSLTQFLYQPSAIEIVPDLVHQVPSHCYNVHPESLAHHPRLYQCWNFELVLQGSLTGI